ncbi:hypothetical protein BLNAU_16726 [Blattamonas nauphoetae]|uniref:Uncharacterized protein n=1 Tax=Blattamonas nauphoetae TaxID=2049346 RepID=A0ABQ9XAM7_9EUKA|nr:hypothetical protein BLNAU_16726 [Blattamonas nauphoetae]
MVNQKPSSEGFRRTSSSRTSLHPLTQAFVPSPSVNNSDLDSFLKSLNADIFFSNFFVSCTTLPSAHPAGYISTQTNDSSPSGPTLSPRHAFDQLHNSFVGRGRGSKENNKAVALLSSSGGFFAQPGTVNPQKANSSSLSQNRLHFSSAVNPYSLLDPSQPPLLPTPMKKLLPPHSFSALQLVNHPVLVSLLNTLIHSAYHSQQAQHQRSQNCQAPESRHICDLSLVAHSPLAHSLPRTSYSFAVVLLTQTEAPTPLR